MALLPNFKLTTRFGQPYEEVINEIPRKVLKVRVIEEIEKPGGGTEKHIWEAKMNPMTASEQILLSMFHSNPSFFKEIKEVV